MKCVYSFFAVVYMRILDWRLIFFGLHVGKCFRNEGMQINEYVH